MFGMETAIDPKRVVADGYDRMGPAFSTWVAENPAEVRSWFLREVLARLAKGSMFSSSAAGRARMQTELSAGRRYTASICRGYSSPSRNGVVPTRGSSAQTSRR